MRWILIAITAIMLVACKTTERIEYVDRYHNTVSRDTVMQYDKDSVFVNQFVKGDTVFNVKYIERIRYKDKIVVRIDTVKHIDIQTITETKKVVPSWCYQYIIFTIIIFAIFFFYFFVIRKR